MQRPRLAPLHSSALTRPPSHCHRRLPLLLLSLLSFLSLLPLSSGTRLFFSAYIHVSATPDIRVLELFNPGCHEVELQEYHVRVAPYTTSEAGAVWGTAIPIVEESTLLASKGHHTICSERYSSCMNNVTSVNLNFDGDDAVGLFHNNVLIDVIGHTRHMLPKPCANCPGGLERTGAPWQVGSTPAATRGHALRRKSRVVEGTVDWFRPKGKSVFNDDSAEWIVDHPNPLGSFQCDPSACPCPSSLIYATCGTLGSSWPLANFVWSIPLQVVCPLDCLTRVVSPLANNAGIPETLNVPPLVGSLGVYSMDSPVCLAAMHSGLLTFRFPSLVNTGSDPPDSMISTLCNFSPTTLDPLYSDAALFPASNRPNGRPHIRFLRLANSQNFVAATTPCLRSIGGNGMGYRIELLEATLCSADHCGGHTRGYCNQNTGVCHCNGLYYGDRCQLKHCRHECYNGHCDPVTGECVCTVAGTYGPQCILRTCDCGTPPRGTCDPTTGRCHCDPPYFGVNCEQTLCKNNCTGHGRCDTATGRCHCDSLHMGEDCSLRPCRDRCSGFGMCDYSIGQCRCVNSAPSPVPSQCLWDSCPTSNSLPCSGHGVCDYHTRRCTCHEGWVGERCDTETWTG